MATTQGNRPHQCLLVCWPHPRPSWVGAMLCPAGPSLLGEGCLSEQGRAPGRGQSTPKVYHKQVCWRMMTVCGQGRDRVHSCRQQQGTNSTRLMSRASRPTSVINRTCSVLINLGNVDKWPVYSLQTFFCKGQAARWHFICMEFVYILG